MPVSRVLPPRVHQIFTHYVFSTPVSQSSARMKGGLTEKPKNAARQAGPLGFPSPSPSRIATDELLPRALRGCPQRTMLADAWSLTMQPRSRTITTATVIVGPELSHLPGISALCGLELAGTSPTTGFTIKLEKKRRNFPRAETAYATS